MKTGITIRIGASSLRVEKRSPYALVKSLVGSFLCTFSIMAFSDVRGMFLDAIHEGDLVIVSLLTVPLLGLFALFSYGAFRYSTAEVLLCDIRQLHWARRSGFGRWQRLSFAVSDVSRMRWEIIRHSKYAVTSGLVFEDSKPTTYKTLEDISAVQADQILDGFRSFGVDTVHDDATPMLVDIEKHGWFVNPWRSDSHAATSKEAE